MSLTLVYAAISFVVSGLLLWFWRRRFAHSRPGRAMLAQVVAAAFITIGVLIALLWGWANTATETSQFARAVLWGDSDVGDVDRFPTRVIRAGGEPAEFELAFDSATIDRYPAEPDRGFIDFLEAKETRSFVVIRDGKLVVEEYFGETEAHTLQPSFSIAKSVISALVGIAHADGSILRLQDPVTDYLPELLDRDQRFGDVTIHSLLTMSSGLAFADGWLPWDDPANTYYGINLRSAALGETRFAQPPGLTWHYNDWNVILLGLVLEEVTNVSVSEFAETRLWQPMGAAHDASWSLDSSESGFEKSFVGVNATALDYARFGSLYLGGGIVGDTAVLDPVYVADSTRLDASTDPNAEYQYLWWVDVDSQAFFAAGDHCQFIFVDPSIDAVIVRTGSGCGGVDWPSLLADLSAWMAER